MDKQLQQILKMPTLQKLALLLLITVLIFGSISYFVFYPKYQERESLQAELGKLNVEIAEKQKKLNDLPRLKAELDELNLKLEAALKELPLDKEIPSLLTNVTNVGKTSGLNFITFKPVAKVS